MDAHVIENKNPSTPQNDNDKETLSALIDLMGQIDGGIENEDFKELKEVMMNSGMTTEGLISLLGNNFAEAIISRPIINVGIQKLTSTAVVPTYSHTTDACADIYADEDVTILPGCTVPVSTGIAFAIPDGFVVHVYARSGLSLKTGLRLANSVGVIDAGYRDELKILCWNAGNEPIVIEKGMRIAQMDIMQSPAIEFYEVENVKDFGEDRMGGFGSSGLFASDLNG
jgi:dUTP pyrophosphatase